MPFCPDCPGRFFTDAAAVRMHRESKHRLLECEHCDRKFTTEDGRDAHAEAKHPPMFECEYCDKQFTTDQGRLSHQHAKHPPMFECRYCDREFTSDKGRETHEKVKHPTFECHYCDSEFNSAEAREQHENAKHMAFECRYCDKEFSSKEACEQHEEAKHTSSCPICGRDFSSEDALRQHQNAKHPSPVCRHCSQRFSSEWARQQHECATHNLRQGGWTFGPGHAKSGPTLASTNLLSLRSCSSTSDGSRSTETSEEEVSVSAITRPVNGSQSPVSPYSASDEGEILHSTSGIFSANANAKDTTAHLPRSCASLLEPCTCSICERTSSVPFNPDQSATKDAESTSSDDNICRDDSMIIHPVTYRCPPCLESFETKEAFQDHVCPVLNTVILPHCPMCFTLFSDLALLQEHIEGALPCEHCQVLFCSDTMMQDHILSHPLCGRCGKSFANNLALCAHVESDHPVVVCWDCNGVVVEKSSLEAHYTESIGHPSCRFCGIGKRDSADMDEHVKDAHASTAEMENQPEGGNVDHQVGPKEEVPVAEGYIPEEGRDETVTRQSSEQVDRISPPSAVEIVDTFRDGDPGGGSHSDSLHVDVSLSSSSQLPMPPPIKHVDEGTVSLQIASEAELDVSIRHCGSPSPTPSEHGSEESRVQLLVSEVTNRDNDEVRSPSLATSVSAEPFSDMSTHSSPSSTSSNQSVVFVSADGIPDYIRENRAVLVATSASNSGTPSDRTPFRLGSFPPSSLSSSLSASLDASLDVPAPTTGQGIMTHRLHCRICLRDPCEDTTATMCGHIFCKRCITKAVIAASECPVCKSATLLYCLFQLHLSV